MHPHQTTATSGYDPAAHAPESTQRDQPDKQPLPFGSPSVSQYAPYPSSSIPPTPPPPAKAFPSLGQGGADFTLQFVHWQDITRSKGLCHRARILGSRVGKLAARMQSGEQLPPVLVWQEPDGKLFLLDGWHRWEVANHLGQKRTWCLVLTGPLDIAVCKALSLNIPRKGFRNDENTVRALTMMATVLNRSLTEDEAKQLGLAWVAHQPFSEQTLSLISLPTVEGAIQAPSTIPRAQKSGTKPQRANRKKAANSRF